MRIRLWIHIYIHIYMNDEYLGIGVQEYMNQEYMSTRQYLQSEYKKIFNNINKDRQIGLSSQSSQSSQGSQGSQSIKEVKEVKEVKYKSLYFNRIDLSSPLETFLISISIHCIYTYTLLVDDHHHLTSEVYYPNPKARDSTASKPVSRSRCYRSLKN